MRSLVKAFAVLFLSAVCTRPLFAQSDRPTINRTVNDLSAEASGTRVDGISSS